jgi:hypothetical protein
MAGTSPAMTPERWFNVTGTCEQTIDDHVVAAHAVAHELGGLLTEHLLRSDRTGRRHLLDDKIHGALFGGHARSLSDDRRAKLNEATVEVAHVADRLSPRLQRRWLHSAGASGHGLPVGGFWICRHEGDFKTGGHIAAAIGPNGEFVHRSHRLSGKSQHGIARVQLSIEIALVDKARFEAECFLIECDRFRHIRNVDDGVSEFHARQLSTNVCFGSNLASVAMRAPGQLQRFGSAREVSGVPSIASEICALHRGSTGHETPRGTGGAS